MARLLKDYTEKLPYERLGKQRSPVLATLLTLAL